ncbi:unnamed protein product [Zymoseptoria tritici ST99CH_1A5]|uniref:Major facilitator superfamily (MFS) profile domain-containing protein n=1 Tax=Zymoseptoria tritici ST99CH_1A5 TaxID=1276529 RepID=A0A1Y6LZY8_ZYMTR|nr:unnamed protein product [Zymoseptoria tritici ST99CH_1A5]
MPFQDRDERRASFASTISSSEKSYKSDAATPYASRSITKPRDLDEIDTLDAQRTISFDNRNEKVEDELPRPAPTARRNWREIETPQGPVRQNTATSLASLSQQQYRGTSFDESEPVWPTDWRAYTCLFGGFLLMFNSWGLVNTYGTYSSFYMQHLLPGRDILLLNLVGSTQSFVVLILSAVVGRFLDAGYSRTLMIVGTIFVSIGSFVLSAVNGNAEYNDGNYPLIWLTQGFLTGLGMACFFVSSSQVVATWFKAKKGFAIGVVASGASIAGLLYPMMTKFLIQKQGFNMATRYVAVVVLLTSALAVIIARPNPAHQTRKPDTWFKVSIFWDTHAFHNHAYSFLVAAIAFLFFGFYAVFFNLEEWAVEEGFGYRKAINTGVNAGIEAKAPRNSIETFWLLSIMNATSTIGRLGSAYLCDHFGALNVHATVTAVASILVLALWSLASTLPSAIAFVVIFGAFSGAVIGLPPASVAYILGPTPEAQAKLGQWTGMMYSCAAIFALTGPVIAGHLITEYSTFLTVQLWSGACMMMSAACMAGAIWCRRKQDQARDRKMSGATALIGGDAEKA